MAKTSIYLSDDLAEQVRSYSIPVSEVAQDALRQAVKNAQLKENAMTDMQAVAERLRETQRTATMRQADAQEIARALGAEWARREATASELEYVATYSGKDADYRTPTSLLFPASGQPRSATGTEPSRPGDALWAQFQAGARDVWEAVQHLIVQCGDASSLSGGRPCALDAGHDGPHMDDAGDPQHVW
jgi:hypothetical protein